MWNLLLKGKIALFVCNTWASVVNCWWIIEEFSSSSCFRETLDSHVLLKFIQKIPFASLFVSNFALILNLLILTRWTVLKVDAWENQKSNLFMKPALIFFAIHSKSQDLNELNHKIKMFSQPGGILWRQIIVSRRICMKFVFFFFAQNVPQE